MFRQHECQRLIMLRHSLTCSKLNQKNEVKTKTVKKTFRFVLERGTATSDPDRLHSLSLTPIVSSVCSLCCNGEVGQTFNRLIYDIIHIFDRVFYFPFNLTAKWKCQSKQFNMRALFPLSHITVHIKTKKRRGRCERNQNLSRIKRKRNIVVKFIVCVRGKKPFHSSFENTYSGAALLLRTRKCMWNMILWDKQVNANYIGKEDEESEKKEHDVKQQKTMFKRALKCSEMLRIKSSLIHIWLARFYVMQCMYF